LKNYFLTLAALFFACSHLTLAETDYNQAKQLLDAGEILPLEQILVKLSRHIPGRVLEVELETDAKQVMYKIELIDHKGLVWELKINAKTGTVIDQKQDD
jgi:uncharacterized membrane protein YkoI